MDNGHRKYEDTEIDIIADVVAEWWTSVIKDPIMDNGATDQLNLLAMHSKCRIIEDIEKEEEDRFFKAIREYVAVKLNLSHSVALKVDYEPYEPLDRIVRDCGIPVHNLPIKTSMYIDTNCIELKYGAGSETQLLYVTKEYCIKKINLYNSRIEEYKTKPIVEFYMVDVIIDSIKSYEKEIAKYQHKLAELNSKEGNKK